MQINIYCLMTNQMPVLLEQRTPWMWAAVMLGLPLYFSHLPPPTTLNPDTCPLITYNYETKMDVHTGKSSILMILWKK